MALTVGGGAAKLSGEKHERRSLLALAMSGRQLWYHPVPEPQINLRAAFQPLSSQVSKYVPARGARMNTC